MTLPASRWALIRSLALLIELALLDSAWPANGDHEVIRGILTMLITIDEIDKTEKAQ